MGRIIRNFYGERLVLVAPITDLLKEKYNIDHSSALDGSLAVMLYYDTTGHDLFYAVAASAPDYWTDAADFETNMNAHVKHDITKCCAIMDGDRPVGFVNQVFIRCDQDEPFPVEIANGTMKLMPAIQDLLYFPNRSTI